MAEEGSIACVKHESVTITSIFLFANIVNRQQHPSTYMVCFEEAAKLNKKVLSVHHAAWDPLTSFAIYCGIIHT